MSDTGRGISSSAWASGRRRVCSIPTATDIALAVAVRPLIGSHLPGALRIFLLTLAVVDDLIAIGIIAFFYLQDIRPEPLLLVLLALGSYTLLAPVPAVL